MNLIEIPSKIHEILTWKECNPIDDYIIHFPCNNIRALAHLSSLRNIDGYIVGSSALKRLIIDLESKNKKKWKPKNPEIFFLNQNDNKRVYFLPFDVVQRKEKTIAEVILNFELPVCRVAINFSYDYWISAQCLSSIYSGKQNIPYYLKDNTILMKTIGTIGKKEVDAETEFFNIEKNEEFLNRFHKHIKKYKKRGYDVNWIPTDIIITWVKKRFYY